MKTSHCFERLRGQAFRSALVLSVLLFASALLTVTGLGNETGSVRGNFDLKNFRQAKPVVLEKYLGKISGKVAQQPKPTVGVWLTGPQVAAPANPPDVTFSQVGYQFSKHLLIVPLGTRVFFPNEDQDFHNIYSLSRTKRFDLGRYRKGSEPIPTVTFDRAGYLLLNCEIHEHMQAHVIIVDSPYYTSSNSRGDFVLQNVPPGSYTLHVQYDKKRSWQQPITVTARRTTEVNFNF